MCTSELTEFMEISASQDASQGTSQGRSFLASSFDLARPGVAPPLLRCNTMLSYTCRAGRSAVVDVCGLYMCAQRWCFKLSLGTDTNSTRNIVKSPTPWPETQTTRTCVVYSKTSRWLAVCYCLPVLEAECCLVQTPRPWCIANLSPDLLWKYYYGRRYVARRRRFASPASAQS